ncbi:MAG: ester cyclase [Marinobacter sp.]|nr:ester cyclase [Marinobacter sp.]
MNTQESARAMYEAWNNRDWDTLRQSIHPDCVYTGPDGQQVNGVDDCLATAWTSFADGFPDGHLDVRSLHSDGDVAISEVRFSGTHSNTWEGIPPTDKRVTFDVCNILEFRDGQIFRERDYLDTLGLFAELGVVEMPE